jgi:hypothetical protein
MLFSKTIIAAKDLDDNATIWKTGGREECEAFAAETHRRVVVARFRDGSHCAASVPCHMK